MCGHRHHRQAPREARPHERVGDAERATTLERLGEHFAAGRLTEDELDERTAAAAKARTRGELAALEADLPRLPTGGRPRRGAWAAAVHCHLSWAVPVALVVVL